MYRNNLQLSHIRRFFVLVTFFAVSTLFTTAKAQQDIPLSGQSVKAKNIFAWQMNSVSATFREYLVGEDDSEAQTIQLRKKFFGSQKFIYGRKEPQNVYTFLGITYRREFKEVMSIHPAAFREVKKATPYRVVSTAGLLTLVGLSAKLLIDSINDSQDISSGRFPDDDGGGSDLALVLVAGGVTIISGILDKKHFKNGVRMFNEKHKLKQQTDFSNK